MKTYSRFETVRKLLIFWTLFIGLGAVGGAIGMLVAPDGSAMGMQDMLPFFQVLPLSEYLYQDFLFPGIALLCVNGIPNLTAAVLLMKRKKAGIVCSGLFGVTLMLWICIQFVIFPMNLMSSLYFCFGLAQALTGYAGWVFYQQEQFAQRQPTYPNIGTNPARLVVYFSRMGYTRQAAMEEADRTGAEIYELKTSEHTEGTLGFWWCGRFGMHRWEMPVSLPERPLSAYEQVTICSPVWVFCLSAPVRAFCRLAHGKIKAADYILVHHQMSSYAGVAREMDELLGISAGRILSICCRRGAMKRRVVLRERVVEK